MKEERREGGMKPRRQWPKHYTFTFFKKESQPSLVGHGRGEPEIQMLTQSKMTLSFLVQDYSFRGMTMGRKSCRGLSLVSKECTVKPQFLNISHLIQFGSQPSCSWKKCLSCQVKLWFLAWQPFHADTCMTSRVSLRQQRRECTNMSMIQFSSRSLPKQLSRMN